MQYHNPGAVSAGRIIQASLITPLDGLWTWVKHRLKITMEYGGGGGDNLLYIYKNKARWILFYEKPSLDGSLVIIR